MKIKVMHIILSLQVGGLEKLVLEMIEKFNNNFKFHICCLDDYGELISTAKALGVNLYLAKRKPGIDWMLPFRLAYILKDKKIDIVHTHNPTCLFYGTLGAKLAGTPVIINTLHGGEKIESLKSRWANRIAFNFNNSVIAVSHRTRNWLLDYYHIPPSKVKVILNGICLEKYMNINEYVKEEKKRELGVNGNTQLVGTVARLSYEKDQFTLINAFAEVCRKTKNVKLLIVGDGILRKELENHVRYLGIMDKVLFLGLRHDIPEILSSLNIFVLSSLREGISLTLLEAMVAGKPVVATDVGGNPEVVVNGVTGFIVPPKNTHKMADAILKILTNTELAKKIGEAGRKRVEEKFSLDRMVKEYEEVYEECLARKKHRLALSVQ